MPGRQQLQGLPQHRLVHPVDIRLDLRCLVILIPIGQGDGLFLFQISQVQNRPVLQVFVLLLHRAAADTVHLARAGGREDGVIVPALLRSEFHIVPPLLALLLPEQNPLHSQVIHHLVLELQPLVLIPLRQIVSHRGHIAEGQRGIALIEENVPAVPNQGVKAVLIVRRLPEHVCHVQHGGGERRGTVKTVVHLAVAHAQPFVHVHDLGVQRGGEQAGRGVACEGSVVLRLPGELLQPVEPLFPAFRLLVQRLIVLLLPQVGAAAHRAQAGDISIDGAFRHHDRQRHYGQPSVQRAVLFGPVQVEEHRVKADESKGQQLHAPLEVLMVHELLAEQEKARRPQISVQNLLPLQLPHMPVRVMAHGQHQEDIDKGLSRRQGIRIVQAMPDEVQHIGAEAKQQESCQPHAAEFLPDGDAPVHQVQRYHQQHRAAAVDIGPVVQPPLRIDAHAVPGQHIQDGEIGLYLLREVHVPEIRPQDGADLGDQQHRRHASRQKGVQGKARDVPPADVPHAAPLRHQEQPEV